jgi:hypothetical protein
VSEDSQVDVLLVVEQRIDVINLVRHVRDYESQTNDPSIDQMTRNIASVYQRHILSADMDISTLHMLQAIENKIQRYLNLLEQADASLLAEAEKVVLNEYDC